MSQEKESREMLQGHDFIIRQAGPADAEQLADIYLAVRRQTFLWVDPGHFRHEDFGSHAQGEEQILAETVDGIAGFLSLYAPEDFIHMLFVLPHFQNKGVGSALLRALPGWPDRRYRLKCLAKNTAALAFYRGKGFCQIGNGSSAEGAYEELVFPGKGAVPAATASSPEP